MTRQRFDTANERGFALIYMAGTLTALLLFAGLAVDAGRAYVVKAQLSKAVDGAALGAARMLNSGDPHGEDVADLQGQLPARLHGNGGWRSDSGRQLLLPHDQHAGGRQHRHHHRDDDPADDLMKLARLNTVTVSSTGEAQRRLVDLSLVIDVSGSIGSKWGAVRDASRAFVNSFDKNGDRIALVTYSDATKCTARRRYR